MNVGYARPRARRRLAILVAAAAVAGCDGSGPSSPSPSIAVVVSPAAVTLELGQTAQLTATVSGAADSAAWWRSSRDGVATVTASGLVTGIAPGEAIVSAIARAYTSKRAQAVVTVVPAWQFFIVPGGQTLQVGESLQYLTNAPEPSLWRSVPETVAVIDSTGRATAVAPGTATITARLRSDTTRKAFTSLTVIGG